MTAAAMRRTTPTQVEAVQEGPATAAAVWEAQAAQAELAEPEELEGLAELVGKAESAVTPMGDQAERVVMAEQAATVMAERAVKVMGERAAMVMEEQVEPSSNRAILARHADQGRFAMKTASASQGASSARPSTHAAQRNQATHAKRVMRRRPPDGPLAKELSAMTAWCAIHSASVSKDASSTERSSTTATRSQATRVKHAAPRTRKAGPSSRKVRRAAKT